MTKPAPSDRRLGLRFERERSDRTHGGGVCGDGIGGGSGCGANREEEGVEDRKDTKDGEGNCRCRLLHQLRWLL
jgi:hypothetical protein